MHQVQIHVAFQNVPAPSLTRRGYEPIFDAQGGFSSIRELDVPVALPDDWRLLSDEVLQQVALDLEDLAPAAFRYFLPAVLTSALHPSRRSSLAYALAKSLDIVLLRPMAAARSRAQIAGLTLAQCSVLEEAIAALDYLGCRLAQRGLDWIAQHRDHIDTAAAWWDHLHDRHAQSEYLCQVIALAFDGIPPPDEHHVTLHEAECADSGLSLRSNPSLFAELFEPEPDQGPAPTDDAFPARPGHFGRWQELPDQHVVACQFALPRLDEQGMHYYLPAIMTFLLRRSGECDDDGYQAFGGHLADDGPWRGFGYQPPVDAVSGSAAADYDGAVSYGRALRLFDRQQRRALGLFLRFHVADPSLRAGWQRVLDAELQEERPDWLVLLKAPVL